MSIAIELDVGLSPWRMTVPSDSLIPVHRHADRRVANSPAELMRQALQSPFGLEVPLHRALTADDRVVIVLDESLPQLAELLPPILDELQQAGVPTSAVTILVPPEGGHGDWIDQLPDAYADLTVEVHDVEAEKSRAYLCTTRAGRRVYLNRTLVEADFLIVLSGRRYDATFGYAGAEVALFPALSTGETLSEFVGKFSLDQAPNQLSEHAAESSEVAWLLGTPLFLQVIEGAGDSIHEIVATLPHQSEIGIQRQNARWRGEATRRAELVIAAISGDPRRIRFEDLAAALNTASRVVQTPGRIVLLTASSPTLREGAELLLRAESLDGLGLLLKKRKPDDWPAAAMWLEAVQSTTLYMASQYPPEVVEDLFATPLASPEELQKLINQAKSVIIITDAHKTML